MTLAKFIAPALLALLALCFHTTVQAEARISSLSFLDKQFMDNQRATIVDLTERHFGSSLNGNREHDLELLQRLLDRRLVRPDQRRELQAMGYIMGELLAAELGLHWVIYEDSQGRSRALRYKETENYLFPMTMVSRRREAGSDLPIVDIYAKARAAIAPLIPKLPFQ